MIGAAFVKLLTATLRFRYTDLSGEARAIVRKGLVCVFWHNRVMVIPHVARTKLPRSQRVAAIASASRDGSIIEGFLRSYRIEAVRGSTSRKGISALLNMCHMVKEGYVIGMAPDGPRGPVYELAGGVVKLAEMSGRPLLPIHIRYEGPCLRLHGWDGFMVPLPFTEVRVTMGPLHYLRPIGNEEEFEAERLRLQEAMRVREFCGEDAVAGRRSLLRQRAAEAAAAARAGAGQAEGAVV